MTVKDEKTEPIATPVAQSLPALFAQYSAVLAICGYAVCVMSGVWLISSHLPIAQKNVVWLLFAFIGIVFPIKVLALSAFPCNFLGIRRWLSQLRIGFAIAFGTYVFAFVLCTVRTPSSFLPVVLELLALLCLVAGRTRTSITAVARTNWAFGVLLFALLTLCWSIDLSLIWWDNWGALVDRSIYSLLVFLTAIFMSTAWVFSPANGPDQPKANRFLELAVFAVGAVVFCMASLRTFTSDGLGAYFDLTSEIHHWGVYIGPAQMVRQGGLLLWDVPSQYGFLSVLLPALLPFRSVWQSFYMSVVACQLATAIFLYFLLRRASSGLLGLLLPVPLVLAIVFLKPWYPQGIVGTQIWPAITAYRFGWDYAIFAVAYFSAIGGVGRRRLQIYCIVGSILWTGGCLWSCETAVWSTAIWFPVLGHLLYRQWKSDSDNAVPLNDMRVSIAIHLLVPLVLLSAAIGAIEMYYRSRLGHGPDWACYVDYVRAAKSGAFHHDYTLAQAATTYLLVPVIVLVSLVVVASKVVKTGLDKPEVTLLIAAFALVWCLNTYSIAELHPSSMEECGEIFCLMGISSIFIVVRRLRFTGWWVHIVKAAQIPMLVIPLLVSYHIFGFIGIWVKHTFVAPPAVVDRQLPVTDASLNGLLISAGIRPTDPIVFVDDNIMPVRLQDNPGHYQGIAPIWLPVVPCSLIGPMSPDRLGVYVNRYIERRRSGGWLIEVKKGSRFDPAYMKIVTAHLLDHCTPTKSLENVNYRATYYAFKESD